MKMKPLLRSSINRGRVIARFGQASLIRQPNGRWHLQGGSRDDHVMAREWISFFMHEAVLSPVPRAGGVAAGGCSRHF
jgi:hypothetical protein